MEFDTTLCLFVAAALLNPGKALLGSDHVFIQGAPLVGGSQGIYFDRDNTLIVAQVYGRQISKLNAETGEILDQLGFEDGVAFVDDVIVGRNGSLYWTDSFYFETIFSRTPGGTSEPLLPYGTVPFANAITLSDDGSRLFYAQCWNPEPENGVYELNLETGSSATIIDGIFGCASNAMDFMDESLYTPRPYEDRIVKIELADNNSISNVTTGWAGTPQALKFDSTKTLYATNAAIGEVARINLTDPDTDNNREIVATFPSGWIDNLAFDKDDRLYVSSSSDATIVEVLPSGNTRIVSPGKHFSIPMGVALLNGTLFTVLPAGVFGFDSDTGEKKITVRTQPGSVGALLEPSSVTAWDGNLILMSFSRGALQVYDPFTGTLKLNAFFAGGPLDAHPFRGGLLVTEFATGHIVRASGPKLATREIIAATPAAAFLAGDDNNVYFTALFNNTIFQIIADGEILSPPVIVATGFDAPEGIALCGNALFVVDGGSETLKEVDLRTGEIRDVATDLEFFPGIPGLEIGYPNDVVVDDSGNIFVNGDRANVIYKFTSEDQDDTSMAAGPSTGFVFDCVVASIVLFFLFG